MEKRERLSAELRQKLLSGEDTHGALWEAVIACQGQMFYTASGPMSLR